MVKEITTSFNLDKNVLLNLADLYPNISYYLNIASKTLEIIQYEITINNIDLSSQPFDYMYIYEYPSRANNYERLHFKKDGNNIKVSSFYRNTHCNTENTAFIIKSNTNIKLLSIKVDVTGGGLYYLTKGVGKNINILLSKQNYYFAIDVKDNKDKKVSININLKSVKDYPPFYLLDYFEESNKEFKLGAPFSKSTNFKQKDNEFISTVEIEFSDFEINYYSFEVLLLRVESNYDLEDFNIEFKFKEKNNENKDKNKIDSNTLHYLLITVGIFSIFSFICFIARFFCKTKSTFKFDC